MAVAANAGEGGPFLRAQRRPVGRALDGAGAEAGLAVRGERVGRDVAERGVGAAEDFLLLGEAVEEIGGRRGRDSGPPEGDDRVAIGLGLGATRIMERAER